MTIEEITQQFLQAMETIADNKINSVKYDQTYIMKIKDISKREEGKYLVSNDSMQFTAVVKEEDFTTYYTKGDQVYVLIPQGDFNNDKIILGRVANSQLQDYYTYRTQFERVFDMISKSDGNQAVNKFVLNNGYNLDDAGGLLSPTIGQITIKDTEDETNIEKLTKGIQLGYWMDNTGKSCSAFFDTFGFSVTVQTVGTMPAWTKIDYDITFFITYIDGKKDVITFDARTDMTGNMMYFILPNEQQKIYDNLNNNCIQAILAVGSWHFRKDEAGNLHTLDQTEENWEIYFNNLRFINGYKITSFSKDLLRIYSLGSNVYESGKDTTRKVELIWAKYNAELGRFESYFPTEDPKIIWQKSNTVINDKDSLADSGNWLTISAYNNQMSAMVPMNGNQATTHVQALVTSNNVTYDVPVIKFRSATEGEQASGDDDSDSTLISFRFEEIGSDDSTWITAPNANNLFLYNNKNQLKDSSEASRDRRIVVLIDGQENAVDAHYLWSLPDESNCMMTFPNFNAANADSNKLLYRIKEKYVSGLNNKIKVRVMYNGQFYDKSVTLNFGYPEYLSGHCVFELITGLDDAGSIKTIDVAKRGPACMVVNPAADIYRFDVFARLVGKTTGENFTYALKPASGRPNISWQVFCFDPTNTENISTRVNGVMVESYDWDSYLQCFRARIKITRSAFNISTGLGIKCSAALQIENNEPQQLTSYLSIPTITDTTIIDRYGPTDAILTVSTADPDNTQNIALGFEPGYNPAWEGSYSFLGFSYMPTQQKSFNTTFEKVESQSIYNPKYSLKTNWGLSLSNFLCDMIIYTPNGSMDFVLTQLFFFFKDRRKFAESNPTDPSFINSTDPATLFSQEDPASSLYTTLSGLTAEQKAVLRNLLLSEE